MKEKAQNIEVLQNFSMDKDGQEAKDNERNQSTCYHYCLQVELENFHTFCLFYLAVAALGSGEQRHLPTLQLLKGSAAKGSRLEAIRLSPVTAASGIMCEPFTLDKEGRLNQQGAFNPPNIAERSSVGSGQSPSRWKAQPGKGAIGSTWKGATDQF